MRVLSVAILAAAGLLPIGLALLVPLAAALLESVRSFDAACLTIGPRELGLLLRGLGVAGAASLLSVLLGSVIAPGLAGGRRGRWSGLALWACAVVALTPPYIYAYAWSFPVLPGGVLSIQTLRSPVSAWLATSGRAILCLALWSAPVSALLLAAGWRCVGRPAATLASLDGGPWRTLARVIAPAMAPWIGLAMLATLALTLTEFTICHLCTVATWNTEILAEVQLLAAPGRAFVLAWPLILALAAIVAPLAAMRGRIANALTDLAALPHDAELSGASDGGPPRAAQQRGVGLAAALLILLSGPLLLGLHVRQPGALLGFARTFPQEWRWALAIGAGTALASGVIAVAADAFFAVRRRWSRAIGSTVFVIALGWALAPPVLVGDAFKAAYQRAAWLSDSVAIVILVEAARYSVIPIALTALAARVRVGEFDRAALLDRADARQAYLRVRLPLVAPALLSGSGLVGVLALGEVAASSMVAPPGVNSLAVTLLNQIHFGRDDQVIALCLSVYAAVGIVVAGLVFAMRGRGRVSERRSG